MIVGGTNIILMSVNVTKKGSFNEPGFDFSLVQ
jgi:hypothetical protein